MLASKFWEITVDYLNTLINSLERSKDDIVFCLFSAQGASLEEKSPFLFARAKGRAEKILLESTIREKYIFRPGYICPGRRNPQVGISALAFKPLYKLMPFIGIDAIELAKVMVSVGLKSNTAQILSNKDLRKISKNIS